MNIMQLIKRIETPDPWSEGEKIPWYHAWLPILDTICYCDLLWHHI